MHQSPLSVFLLVMNFGLGRETCFRGLKRNWGNGGVGGRGQEGGGMIIREQCDRVGIRPPLVFLW